MTNLAHWKRLRRAFFLTLTTVAMLLLLVSSSFAATDSDDEAETKAQEAAIKTAEDFAKSQVKKFGAKSREALEARTKLVDLYIDGKRAKDALPIADDCFGIANKILPKNDVLRARVLNDVGRALLAADRAPQALVILEESYTYRKEAFGEKHLDTLMTLEHIATAYSKTDRVELAVSMYFYVYNMKKELLGSEHLDLLPLMEKYAVALSHQHVVEALEVFKEIHKIRKAKLGPDHKKTRGSSGMLAIMLLKAGKPDEAIKTMKDEVEDSKMRLGETHIRTIKSTSGLIMMLMFAGKLDEATELSERTYRLAVEKVGKESEEALEPQHIYGMLLLGTGKLDQALEVLKSGYELSTAKLGTAHSLTIQFRNDLGGVYGSKDDFQKAVVLFAENYEYFKRDLDSASDPDSILGRMEMYGSSLAKLDRLLEAQKVFEHILAESSRRLGATHEKTMFVMFRLARTYGLQNKTDDATKLYKETIELRLKNSGPTHPRTCQVMASFGEFLVEQNKDLDQAEKLLLDSVSGFDLAKTHMPEAQFANFADYLADAREALVKLYKLQKKPDEVAKWREPVKK